MADFVLDFPPDFRAGGGSPPSSAMSCTTKQANESNVAKKEVQEGKKVVEKNASPTV